MKLSELKHLIDRICENMKPHNDPDVVIKVKMPYTTIGATPTVTVKNASLGFDWDNGKFIFHTQEPLTPSDRDFAEQMKQMQERAGWADYENRNLKAEIKRLKKLMETSK